MASAPLTIRLPADLKKQLQKAAAKDDRTVTSFVVHAIKKALGK